MTRIPRLPFFKFYPEDWIRDTQRLPPIVKGAWIHLLCKLWESETRGEISWPLWAYATELRTTVEEAWAILHELITESRTADGEFLPATEDCQGPHCHARHDTSRPSRNCHEFVHLVSRRMMREEQQRVEDRYYERIKKQKQRQREMSPQCPPNVPQSPAIRSQEAKKLREEEEEDKNKNAPVPALAVPDWIPKESWELYLAHRKKRRASLQNDVLEKLIKTLTELRALGHDPAEVLLEARTRNWMGLKVDWIHKPENLHGNRSNITGPNEPAGFEGLRRFIAKHKS